MDEERWLRWMEGERVGRKLNGVFENFPSGQKMLLPRPSTPVKPSVSQRDCLTALYAIMFHCQQ